MLALLSLLGTIHAGIAILVLRAKHWVPRFPGSPLLILVLAMAGASLPWIAARVTGFAWAEPRLAIVAAIIDGACFAIVGAFLAFEAPDHPERRDGYGSTQLLQTPAGKLGASLGGAAGIGAVMSVLTFRCPGMDVDSAALVLAVGGLIGGMAASAVLFLILGAIGELVGRLRRR